MLNNSKTETEYETLIVELKAFIAKLNSPHSIDEEDGSLQSTVNVLSEQIEAAITAIVGTNEQLAVQLTNLGNELLEANKSYSEYLAFTQHDKDFKKMEKPEKDMDVRVIKTALEHYFKISNKEINVLGGLDDTDLREELKNIASQPHNSATIAIVHKGSAGSGHIFTVFIPENSSQVYIIEPFGHGMSGDASYVKDLVAHLKTDTNSSQPVTIECNDDSDHDHNPARIQADGDPHSCGRIAFAAALTFANGHQNNLDANSIAWESIHNLHNAFSQDVRQEKKSISCNNDLDRKLLENYSQLILFFSMPLTDEEKSINTTEETDVVYLSEDLNYFIKLHTKLVKHIIAETPENKELLINIHNRFLQKAEIILDNPGEDSDASEVLFGDFTIGDLTEKVSEIEGKLEELKSELETDNSSDYFEDHDSDFYANESSEDSESPLRNIETLKGLIKEIQSEIDDIKEFQNISLGTDDEALSQDDIPYRPSYKQKYTSALENLLNEKMEPDELSFLSDFLTKLKNSNSFEDFEKQFVEVRQFPAPDSLETIEIRVKKLMDAAKEMARNDEFAPRQSELNTPPIKTNNEPHQDVPPPPFDSKTSSDSLRKNDVKPNGPKVNSDDSSDDSYEEDLEYKLTESKERTESAIEKLNKIFEKIESISNIQNLRSLKEDIRKQISDEMETLNFEFSNAEFYNLYRSDKYPFIPRLNTEDDINSDYFINAAEACIKARIEIINDVLRVTKSLKRINMVDDLNGFQKFYKNAEDLEKTYDSDPPKAYINDKEKYGQDFINLFNKLKPENVKKLNEFDLESIRNSIETACDRKKTELTPQKAESGDTPTKINKAKTEKDTSESDITIGENTPQKDPVPVTTEKDPQKDSIPDFCFFHQPVSKRKADDNQNHDDVKISIKNITLEPGDIDKLKEGLELFSQNHNITLHAHYDSANKVFSMGIPTEQTLAKLQLKGKPEALKKQKQVATFEMMLTYFKNKTPDSKIVISGNNPELVALAEVMAEEINTKLNKPVSISRDPAAKQPTKAQIDEAQKIYKTLKENSEITIDNGKVDIDSDTTWENFSIHSR